MGGKPTRTLKDLEQLPAEAFPIKISGYLGKCSECGDIYIGQVNALTCSDKCRSKRYRRAVQRQFT